MRTIQSKALCSTILLAASAWMAGAVTSPDGHLAVDVTLDSSGSARYEVRQDGKVVLAQSRLGLVRDDEDFTKELVLLGESSVERISDEYDLLTSKRLHNTYTANRQVFHLASKSGKKLDIVFHEGVTH